MRSVIQSGVFQGDMIAGGNREKVANFAEMLECKIKPAQASQRDPLGVVKNQRFVLACGQEFPRRLMPNLFLNRQQMEQLRLHADAGEQPWADAYQALLVAAELGLQQTPLSVRQNGGSPHFRADVTYVQGQDGVFDEVSNRESFQLGKLLGDTVRDLALAHRLTRDARYADHALILIHTWCINQNTRMFATGRVEDAWTRGGIYGGDVLMFSAFRNLFLAISLLDDYPGWNLTAHAAVRRWVRAMVEPQRELMFFEGIEMYNNWEDDRLAYLATGALALEDLDLLASVFDRWRQIIPMKMTAEGELPRETRRTRSMTYTLRALRDMTFLAEIASQFGVNLYDYSGEGKSLRLALDYATRHLLNMEQWPHPMIRPLANEAAYGLNLTQFELAFARWGDKRYLAVINAWGGRPVMVDHATLLFARP